MGVASLVAAGRHLIDTTLLDQVIWWQRLMVSDGQGGSIESWTAHTDQLIPARFGILVPGDLAGDETRIAAEGNLEYVPTTSLLVRQDLAGIARGDNVVDDATARIWRVTNEVTAPSATSTVRRLLIREL